MILLFSKLSFPDAHNYLQICKISQIPKFWNPPAMIWKENNKQRNKQKKRDRQLEINIKGIPSRTRNFKYSPCHFCKSMEQAA